MEQARGCPVETGAFDKVFAYEPWAIGRMQAGLLWMRWRIVRRVQGVCFFCRRCHVRWEGGWWACPALVASGVRLGSMRWAHGVDAWTHAGGLALDEVADSMAGARLYASLVYIARLDGRAGGGRIQRLLLVMRVSAPRDG